MPRFYIDTTDQDQLVRDEQGHDFSDVETARNAAIDALPDMARDMLPNGDSRAFVALVRDEDGKALLQACLSFSVTELVHRSG